MHTVPGLDVLSSPRPAACLLSPDPLSWRAPASTLVTTTLAFGNPFHSEPLSTLAWSLLMAEPLPPPASPLRPCSCPPTRLLCSSQHRPTRPPAWAGSPHLPAPAAPCGTLRTGPGRHLRREGGSRCSCPDPHVNKGDRVPETWTGLLPACGVDCSRRPGREDVAACTSLPGS